MQRRARSSANAPLGLFAQTKGCSSQPKSEMAPLGSTTRSWVKPPSGESQLVFSLPGTKRSQIAPKQRPFGWWGESSAHWVPSGGSERTHAPLMHTGVWSQLSKGAQPVPSVRLTKEQPDSGRQMPLLHGP